MITHRTFACAVLAVSFLAAPLASAQLGRRGMNSGPNNSASAQAGQAVRDAEKARQKIQQDINKIKARIRHQLESKPEWTSVNNDLKKAELEMKAADKAAMAKLTKNPDYQAALKQREEARKTREQSAAGGASDADLAKADQQYIDASLRMKQIEKQALSDDAAYNDAKTKYDSAKAKKDQLDSQVNDALQSDQEYTQLKQELDQADQQVKQAKDQLAQARQQEEQQRQQEIRSRSQSSGSGYGGR